jgi:integrase/recombinase XerD
LQHIVKHGEQRRRTIKLSSPQPRPRVLTTAEAETLLDACDHLRDRLLFALLLDTGIFSGGQPAARCSELGVSPCS